MNWNAQHQRERPRADGVNGRTISGSDDGAGTAEYALLLALIAAASVSALTAVGSAIQPLIQAAAGMF